MPEREARFISRETSPIPEINLEDDPAKLEKILQEAWENNQPLKVVSLTENFKTKETIGRRELFTEKEKPWEFFVSDEVVFEGKNDENKKIDFHSLAPAEVSFANYRLQPMIKKNENEPTEEWDYHDDTHDGQRVKIIFYSGLDRVGDRLSLLHEIGHAWQKSPGAKKGFDEWLDDFKSEYEIARQEKRKKASSDEVLFRPNKKSILRPVDFNEVLNFLEIGSKEERQAWAFALETLRRFRQQGLDLEPSLKSKAEIREFIHGKEGLESYEAKIRKHFPDNPKLYGFYNKNFKRKRK